MSRFHISEDGNPRVCRAEVKQCPLGYSNDEHYATKAEARASYELQQSKNILPEVEELDYFDQRIKEFAPDDYDFSTESEYYGIPWKAPDIDPHIAGMEVYEDVFDGEAKFYRFEAMEEVFNDFDGEDVRRGYSMNVPLNTLQRYVSPDLVELHGNRANVFAESPRARDEEEDARYARVAVIKNELFIVDGNHRFAAARDTEQKYFEGIVVEFSDDMSEMRTVPPLEFNKRFKYR